MSSVGEPCQIEYGPEIPLDVCTPEGKTWLARITGVSEEFGFDRTFCRYVDRQTSKSGKTGTVTYPVSDGLYESNEGRRRLGRRYWRVADGVISEISREQVTAELREAGK
jgi:hypothetical protein